MGDRRLIAIDCETDPFIDKRVPQPFIWGAFDGKRQRFWDNTDDFVLWLSRQYCYAYAHNGGKFDFMYLMSYLNHSTRAQVIGSRISEVDFGRAKLRDSYSIMQVSMAEIQKEKIDYWTFEKHVREKHKKEIEDYLAADCRYLWELVAEFRRIAGTKLTIASNAFQFGRKLGIKPSKTNFRFDREMREYYFGGRTECFQPGTHKNLKIIDIVSSYPDAMLRLHPTGADRDTARGKAKERVAILEKEGKLGQAFLEIECFSKGAFPLRDEKGELKFPHTHAKYKITGWEYIVAKKHGLIENENVISVTYFKEFVDLSEYIEHWFDYKASWDKKKNPIQYTIGKRMLNAYYGKLSQNPTKYYDYEFHPGGTPCDKENGFKVYTEDFMGLEVHRRSAMWKYKEKYGDKWEEKLVFYNVATGASITGFARAHLLDAMHIAGPENAIYCDTDSLMLHDCDLSGIKFGKEIGKWEVEGKGLVGHFAGKKLYAIELEEKDKETGENLIKIASKGCRITYDEMQAELNSLQGEEIDPEFNDKLGFDRLKRLIDGEEIEIINPAPVFSIAQGTRFVPRIIRATSRGP